MIPDQPMPISTPNVHPSIDEMHMIYQQICTSYHNIEDFRAKLLGIIPGVTAVGFITTIASNPEKSQALTNLVFPFGLLGALVVLGLFFYEIDNLRHAALFALRGQALEQAMNVVGVFLPPSESIFNVRNAAALIYSISFAGWICIAFWFAIPGFAIFVASIALFIGIVVSFPLVSRWRKRALQEHFQWNRRSTPQTTR